MAKPTIYFDGTCRPKAPGGWGCWGWVCVDGHGTELASGYGTIPRAAGNTDELAHLHALTYALCWAQDMKLTGLRVEGRREVVEAVRRRGDLGALHLHQVRDGAFRLATAIGANLTPAGEENPARELARIAYQETLRERSGGEGAELCTQEQVLDPRPDLSEDSALWGALLALAHEEDEENEIRGPRSLTKALCDLRLLGARIRERARGGYVLGPDLGEGNISSVEEWRACVGQYEVLDPAVVRRLLAGLPKGRQ